MEIVVLPDLSEAQKKHLPKGYVAPLVEGTYDINERHPDGIIYIYVGKCDWRDRFEICMREFTLTVFHEVLHVLCPGISEYVPYAEKVLAEILYDDKWPSAHR